MSKKRNKKKNRTLKEVEETKPTDPDHEQEEQVENDDKKNKFLKSLKKRLDKFFMKLSLLINLLIAIVSGTILIYSVYNYMNLDLSNTGISVYFGMFLSPFIYLTLFVFSLVPSIVGIRYFATKKYKENSLRHLLMSSIIALIMFVGVLVISILFGVKEGSQNILSYVLIILGTMLPQLFDMFVSILYLKKKVY